MSLFIQSHITTTLITTRHPTLIRVWRSDGTHLTSTWLQTLAPHTNVHHEGGPRP